MRRKCGRIPLLVAVCAAALAPQPGYGQVWRDDSLYSQFAWGRVFVVVHADTQQGVRLSAATSVTRYLRTRHSYNEHFNPDSALDWLNSAHSIAVYRGPPPDGDDSTATIHTRPLFAEDSAALVVSRRRRGSAWSDRVSLIFVSSDGKSIWSIEAKPEEADALFRALLIQASRSALSPPDSAPPVEQPDPSSPFSWPVLLEAPVRPRLPDAVQGQDGEVLMQFVVGVDGRAEPESLQPIVYSDPRLVQPAFDVLLAARFRPGTLNGEPVRVRVQQGVRFGPG